MDFNIKEVLSYCTIDGNKIIVNSNLHDIIKLIVKKYNFDILKEIIAIDNKDNIELSYHLFATHSNEYAVLVYKTQNNEVESITDIFQSAIADENEIFDMFGIKFTGNDKLKRLYMPEVWEGYPLKKDYVENDIRLEWNDCNNSKN